MWRATITATAMMAQLALSAGGAPAAAEEAIEVRISIREHRFVPAEIAVPAGRELKLIVQNEDTTPEEFESVGLKVERVIPPGGRAEFKLRPLLPNRNYSFFGEFHPDSANGRLIVR